MNSGYACKMGARNNHLYSLLLSVDTVPLICSDCSIWNKCTLIQTFYIKLQDMMLLQIISLHIAEDFQFDHFGKISYSTSCLPISLNICSFFATEFNMFNQKSIKSTGLFFFLYYTVCISNKSIFQIEVNIKQIIYQSNTL